MVKRKTHNVVMHDGEQWHTLGNVMHDDESGRDILWLNPHVTQRVLKGKELGGKDIPCLMAPYTPKPKPQERAPNPPFDTPPPGMVTPVVHKYDEPPMDFDDDIPF